MKSPLRQVPGSLCLVSVVTVLLVGCGGSDADKQAKNENPPPRVTITNPQVREVVDWDQFTGRLVSPETVEIRARVSGYLDEVHFNEGAEIKEGDLLFTIDPRPYAAIVERMEAQVTSAASRAELAAIESKNAASLQNSQAISSEEYERRAKSAVEAQAILQGAEADLRAAKLNLEFTRIHSPVTGRVSDARVTKGNLVTGGTQDANLLTTVVPLDPIYCYLEVDERSVLKYRSLHREGKRISAQFGKVEAEMELASESGFPHKGFIDFVDNQLDASTGTIRARAVFPNSDRLMAPGFFARVRVPGSGKYEGLLVPDRAIADDQGTSHVWIVGEDNTVVYRKVTTGPILDGQRIIREGLKPGERVVVDGVMSVRQGQKVAPEIAVAPAVEATPKGVESPSHAKPESQTPKN